MNKRNALQETTRRAASEKIADKLAQVKKLLNEAARIADEADLRFSWEGPVYGVGVSYIPKSETWQASGGCEWVESDPDAEYRSETGGVWRSSSNC